MNIFLILLLCNCLIGCVTDWIRWKEVSLATVIVSFFAGFLFVFALILEKSFDLLDELDNIKIFKR